MSHQSDLIAEDIDAFLKAHRHKSLLRFITCGSVDDGKSTLIGRLLFESKMIFSDQLAALERDSRKHGTRGAEIDFALLVDGLAAEREQGITIDVAYRFFSTDRRKFIVADTPGHEQYTRNMITGASSADLAVILIDARKGVLTQTRRHSYLVSLVGIPQVVLAVNKMDLVGYSQVTFERIVADYREFAARIGLPADNCDSRVGDLWPTTCLRPVLTRRGIRGSHCCNTSRPLKWAMSARRNRCDCPCSGSTDRMRISVATRARSHPAACSPAIVCACCRRVARRLLHESSRRMGIFRWPSRASRSH